ncbi:MAG: hypothetical protein AAB972_01985 [Patescibacteria group bacterium]
MKLSYTNELGHNLIESYEYRLDLVEKTKKLVKDELEEAKKEFDRHTTILISVIVGVITILGTANQAFRAENFSQALWTFVAISLSVIFLVFIVIRFNNRKR